MTKKLPWYMHLTKIEFEFSTANTRQSLAFMKEAKKGLRDFCINHGYTDFEFHIDYFYFSGFFKVEEQWWYFSSGDLRLCGIFGAMLVRTANGPKDYFGGYNQAVCYDEKFETNLHQIIKGE